MAGRRTLTIIKPDAFGAGKAGLILAHLEKAGFTLKAARVMHLSKEQAGAFYAVHAGRPFYGELVEFMTRSPVVIMALEGENAIAKYREVMGATDPAKAAEGTIRKKFGASIGENASHGSDAKDTAAFEVSYFFPGFDIA